MNIDFNNPLEDIKSTMNSRLNTLTNDINEIRKETNPVVRFFLKLKYFFKYEDFPPTDSDSTIRFDAIPSINSMCRLIQNAPEKGDGCIRIRDDSSAYTLTYLKCTNMWTVAQCTILNNGEISNELSGLKTITHQEMLKFMEIQPERESAISAKDYSSSIKQSFKVNQEILGDILNSNSDLLPFFKGLQHNSNNYSPADGHKFTVGDVCGSPVTMLLAGYASGTLKYKGGSGDEMNFMTGIMKEYQKIIVNWCRDEQTANGMSDLALKLMDHLQPIVSEPLDSGAHSGLLFLGDNINDRMDFDYEIQARVISLLSSAGAEFLRGNHDVLDFGFSGRYNFPRNPNEKRITVQLRNFFLPALYVSETNTLYTHNGVKLDEKGDRVLYAFPERDGLELNGQEPKGKQICDYITNNISFYQDDFKNNPESLEALKKSPAGFRPTMQELNSCAQKLGIKQVAGHEGIGVQSGDNAIRINGFERINDINYYMVPIAAITGM